MSVPRPTTYAASLCVSDVKYRAEQRTKVKPCMLCANHASRTPTSVEVPKRVDELKLRNEASVKALRRDKTSFRRIHGWLIALLNQPTILQLPQTIIKFSKWLQQVQRATHPTLYSISLITLPESSMSNTVSLSDINSWMDASGGSATVVDTLGLQRLDTTPWDVYADSSDIWWQEQSIPHEKMQARNICEYPSEVNGITDLMLGAFGDTNGANRALIWQWDDDGTWAHAQVRVEHHMRDSMTSLWPSYLPLVIHPAGISTLDLQRWIQKNHAPVSRMKCASDTDDCDFINLVDALRSCRGYATVGWEAEGSYQARLLLAPLGTDLFCVAFPVKGIPDPPTSRSLESDHMKRPVAPSSWTWSRPAPLPDSTVMPPYPEPPYHGAAIGAVIPQRAQQQLWTQPQADYPPPDTIELPQVDHNLFVPGSQATTLAPVYAPSLPHPQLLQHTFAQGLLLLPSANAQQSQQAITLDMPSGGSELDDWQTNAGAMSWGAAHSYNGLPLNYSSDYCLGIGENTTGYTDADMGASFGDTDAFESSVGSGLDIGGDWTHGNGPSTGF